MGSTVLKVLLGWTVLSVLLGPLVGKAIKAHREREEQRGLLAQPEARQDPKVIQVPPDRWGRPGSQANPVHPVRPGCRER